MMQSRLFLIIYERNGGRIIQYYLQKLS